MMLVDDRRTRMDAATIVDGMWRLLFVNLYDVRVER